MAMKKMFRSLITIALCAPLLSGCSLLSLFSNLPEETKDVDRLDARDSTFTAELNSSYTYDGKVYILYKDNTEKEVTEYCTYDALDTSKVGQSVLKIKYETKSVIYSHKVDISVYDPNDKGTLESIRVTLNNDEVEKGQTYTFDGKIEAKYSKLKSYIAVNNEDCTISTVNTATAGNKTLTVTYQGKSATATVKVISKLTGLSASALEVPKSRTRTIALTYTPSDATDKDVTYKSNNTSVATVNENGSVKGLVEGGSTTITVTSKKYSNISVDVPITVGPQPEQDEWTILMYVCGADLESDSRQGGQATADIAEILSVSGQPDDVNIIIQTGGANSWQKYSISSQYNQRYRVKDKSLEKLDDKVYTSYQGMGKTSTLKDFLVWGIESYPADKIGVIFWNHGGGLYGVCYDEKDGDDSLTNNEVQSAVSQAISSTGVDKLEFVGYDACLMQTMEVADFNAPYFNYQVASQESENGTGWDYDTWIDDLYGKKDTTTILQAIADGFIKDNGGTTYNGDQTLSYLDLTKMAAFKTAWEELGSQLSSKITSSNKSTFKSLVTDSYYFAGSDYGYFALFDAYDFLGNVSSNSTFNPGGNYISNAQSAITSLVKYNTTQKSSKDAHGLSFYFGSEYNSSTYSSFTNWRSIISTVGAVTESSSGSGGWDDWGGGWW